GTGDGTGLVTLSGAIGVQSGQTGGLTKNGASTYVLTGSNTYNGPTVIQKGTLIVTGGNDRLPTGTTVTLGDSSNNSGLLQLGNASGASNQTLAGLLTTGAGTGNAVVGGNSSTSILTLNIAATNTFAGALGGAGANQNNLALIKNGSGTLILSGTSNTYSGGTTLNAGVLRVTNTAGSATGSGAVTV